MQSDIHLPMISWRRHDASPRRRKMSIICGELHVTISTIARFSINLEQQDGDKNVQIISKFLIILIQQELQVTC